MMTDVNQCDASAPMPEVWIGLTAILLHPRPWYEILQRQNFEEKDGNTSKWVHRGSTLEREQY